jgi:hypothetical protein
MTVRHIATTPTVAPTHREVSTVQNVFIWTLGWFLEKENSYSTSNSPASNDLSAGSRT